MNILFTICGRAGSKGFKNKNLKTFLDCPLVYYSVAAIWLYKQQYRDDNVYVTLNTDSEELINIFSQQKKVEYCVIRREESLSGDTVPKVSVIANCLDEAEKNNGMAFDVVVDLDITSPIRTVEDIRNAIDKKISRPETDVVYSVTSSRRNPYFNMVKEENGFFVKAIKSEFTSRQQAPTFYDMNASIYAYSPNALKNKPHNTFFNDNADAIIMQDTAVLDIDCEEDFELMQIIAEYLYAHNSGLKEVYSGAKTLLCE